MRPPNFVQGVASLKKKIDHRIKYRQLVLETKSKRWKGFCLVKT